ncbi:MAG: hypothetical protein EOP48_30710 [Sphingobacteriales bacterium]|nr:MAG: hypothetical protein EOP48_30710 [Sphingobacteriales bacterium]
MKHIYLLLIFLLPGFALLQAQDSTAKDVTWTFSATQSGDKSYVLSFKALIEPGWKMFSTTAKDDELNTRINFDSSTRAGNTIGTFSEKGSLKVEKEGVLYMFLSAVRLYALIIIKRKLSHKTKEFIP